MVNHTSKGLVLAGVVACAGAMRAKVDMESSSAVAVVDHIASLLGREHVELRRIAEAAAAQATPGVGGQFTEALEKVVGTIEGTLQPRVQEAHDNAQKQINKAFEAAQRANRLAGEHKAAADSKDEAAFSCVTRELEQKEFHETKQEHLEAAERAEQEACALQQKNRDFSFTAGDDYKFDFKCDHGIQGGCEEKMNILKKHTAEMTSDAEEQYQAKQRYYDDLEADCKTKGAATVAAREAVAAADAAHDNQQDKCYAANQERVKKICEYGDAVQNKGTDEANFKKLIATIEASGTPESEADRQKEWTSLVTTSCMLKKSIALGTKGPVGDADMNACNALAEKTPLANLSKKADEFKALTESHPAVAGPISFSNGEEWVVSGSGENSEDYSKKSFTPALNPTDGEQPFKLCPQDNQDDWRKVILDEKNAAR